MKLKLTLVLLVLALIGAGVITVNYYSYLFAKEVKGEVIGVERVTQPNTVITQGSPTPPSQLYSFAVAIRDTNGEIYTASSEDRQWAVVQKGQCAEAKYFPYPPWSLEKSGTYYGARLIRLFDCPKH